MPKLLQLKLLMRKSKSVVESPCYCDQYRLSQSKVKQALIGKLCQSITLDQFSVFKLLDMYFDSVSLKQNKFIEIESLLRKIVKQDPTLKYSQQDSVKAMIETIAQKLKKQREVHHEALLKQEKAIDEQNKRQKEIEQEISYLKELLNQSQKELENWKSQALTQERQIQHLHHQLSLLQYENKKLKDVQLELNQTIQTLNNKLNILESDKSELSRQCLERSESITKISKEMNRVKQSFRYQAKMEILEQINSLKQIQSPNKSDLIDQLNTSTLSSTKLTTAERVQLLNRSLSADKMEGKEDGLINFYQLNQSLSMSTANPETSRFVNNNQTDEMKKEYLFNHLFVGDVLLNQDNYRYFLVSTLQKHHKNIINWTRLLYRWDPYNLVNIHRYIDGHPHLLLLIKTEKGQHIAAYSKGPFKHRSISNQSGLLISLTNSFAFQNIKKSIVYDDCEVIFGNYDLRVRAGDSRVVSNFGSNGCFYEHKGHYVNTLLGEGKNREARIKHMQIFEVFYEC